MLGSPSPQTPPPTIVFRFVAGVPSTQLHPLLAGEYALRDAPRSTVVLVPLGISWYTADSRSEPLVVYCALCADVSRCAPSAGDAQLLLASAQLTAAPKYLKQECLVSTPILSIHRVQDARLFVHAGVVMDRILPCRPSPQAPMQLEQELEELAPAAE